MNFTVRRAVYSSIRLTGMLALFLSVGCGLVLQADDTFEMEAIPFIEDVRVEVQFYQPTLAYTFPFWPLPLTSFTKVTSPHGFMIRLFDECLSARRFRIHSAVLKGENGTEFASNLMTFFGGERTPAQNWSLFEARGPGGFNIPTGSSAWWNSRGSAHHHVSASNKIDKIDFRAFGESIDLIIDLTIEFDGSPRREIRRTLIIKLKSETVWSWGSWAIT